MADSEDFTRLADQFRRELLAHCYRMLGSVHDAEDLVQETYLRAWRSYDRFDASRASMRTWLYRIATNACLTAIEQRGRRAAPDMPEVTWLEPFPDVLMGGPAGPDGPADPAAIVASREGMRLALVAAFQVLPPRQRAVLILRDVLGWRAAEVAELLDTTTAAVNSALQRARAQLGAVAPAAEEVAEPADARRRAVLDRYAAAFENSDVGALAELLAADVAAEMPPRAGRSVGRADVVRLISELCPAFARPGNRMVATAANGQPAFAHYAPRDDGGLVYPYAIQVLALSGSQVSRLVVFLDTRLFPAFGLPESLPAAQPAGS